MNATAFPENAGHTLLAIARGAIARKLGHATPAPVAGEAWLDTPGAAFVTIMKEDKLRGCIGSLEARRPLGEDVQANAEAAAFRDPRFPPLAGDEFDAIDVEVSVLSPAERLAFRDEADALAQLRCGVDGVIFEYGHHRATFLPQVWAQMATREEFLGHLKYKAGLPPDFWDPSVKLSRYTVIKWRETDLAPMQS